ncbi:MAG: FAD:protein FMN transferase [Gemmatimonadetes bacterium]|nr:FAD:protein FMN transferase [Gemmatimonadota bacterium]
MGTQLRGLVEARDRASGIDVLERAFAEVRRLESLLSTWRDDTELARLNAAEPRVPVHVSPALLAVLTEVAPWTEATRGAFDPAVGALVDVWDLRGRGRSPTPEELAQARALAGPGAFELDPVAGTVTRARSGSWLDSGGFGKGAALREVRKVLDARGVRRALFDFGGQLLVLGAPDGADTWPVGVAHPERRDESVAEIRLRDGSVATTSASERFVEVGGERLGHVLDPRSGTPVPAWGSVTVVAEDPLVADMLSTAVFVLGPKEGAAWAEGRQDVGVLLLVPSAHGLEAHWNRTMERWLVRAAGEPMDTGAAWALARPVPASRRPAGSQPIH